MMTKMSSSKQVKEEIKPKVIIMQKVPLAMLCQPLERSTHGRFVIEKQIRSPRKETLRRQTLKKILFSKNAY